MADHWNVLQAHLRDYMFIMNANARALGNVSTATVNCILAGFIPDGKLVKCRDKGLMGI